MLDTPEIVAELTTVVVIVPDPPIIMTDPVPPAPE
jgi:hypothetical protein